MSKAEHSAGDAAPEMTMTRRLTRRAFVASAAALPIGCAMRDRGAPSVAASQAVRSPLTGQSWHYAKHDLFTGALIDSQIDTVAAVGRTVDIASRSESDEADREPSSGSTGWLHRYFARSRPGGPLPSEVQDPWGTVLVDPHWSQVQIYEPPIPLWPAELQPGWQMHIRSKYRTADETGLPWEQIMKVDGWQNVTVPAGTFRALRYENFINFTSSDLSRANSVRRETIWLAPEVGRWVARESRGSYFFDESIADDQYQESGYRWELLGFT
jgi:hypothetical protein